MLFSTLKEKFPPVKIVHGKPRHPECQGAVERVNRDVKDALFSTMHDKKDQCWLKYLRWIKFRHNTGYHTTIKMSPYEAVYNKKSIFYLSKYSIPEEQWDEIEGEEDLDRYLLEVTI